MRKLFARFFLSAGVLLASLAMVIIVVWFFPGLVVRTEIVGPLLRRFVPELHFQHLALRASSPSFFRKRVEVKLDGASYIDRESGIRVDVPSAVSAIVVDLSPGASQWLQIDSLIAQVASVALSAKPLPQPKEEEGDGSLPSLCGYKVGHVQVGVASFRFGDGPSAPQGSALLRTLPGRHLEVTLAARGSAEDAKAIVDGSFSFLPGPCLRVDRARLAAAVEGKKIGTARLEANLDPIPDDSSLRWKGNIALDAQLKSHGRVKLRSTIDLRPTFGAGTVDLGWQPKAVPLKLVQLSQGTFRWTGGKATDVQFHATLAATAKPPPATGKPSSNWIGLAANGDPWEATISFHQDKKKTNGSFRLTPIDADGKRPFRLQVAADAEGDSRRLQDTLAFVASVNFDAESFTKLAKAAQKVGAPLLGPMSVLQGNLGAEIKAEGRLSDFVAQQNDKGAVAKWKIFTNLKAPSESFVTAANGEFRYGTRTGAVLEGEAELTDVLLTMPYLSLRPPRVFPDGRIHPLGDREIKSAAMPFRYQIHLFTPPQTPLRLRSNLAKALIPIAIDLRLHEKGTSGSLAVGTFPIEVFRRQGRIERFRVAFPRSGTGPELDGKVVIPYAEYTVNIRVVGPAAEPRVLLESDPPLPEQDVYAVLLFGRPLEGLASEDAESVANTRAAALDGAIGLASMWALASTPVESVGYDAATGTFTARVKLQEGTTLVVGSDLDKVGRVGIRKRLGARWYLHTYLSDPFETTGRALATFLEWSLGY